MVKRFVIPFATSGDKSVTPDATDPGGAISYSQGWPVAYQLPDTDPNYRPVGRQELNGVLFDVTGAVAEMQSLGFPAWVPVTGLATPYEINAVTRHNGFNWRNTVANNSVAPGIDNTWVPLTESRTLTTGGTSAALTLTPSPAIPAYASGQPFRVKFSVASTPTSTINVSALGTKLIRQYNAAGVKVAAVFAVDQLGTLVYDGTDFVLLEQLPATPQQATGIRGASSNLKVTVSGTNAVVVITADFFCVADASGNQRLLSAVSLPTLNLATNGANGLDTGPMTANTWYNYGVMWNPTTLAVAGIAWLTSAPLLPAGYTHWGFIDAVRVGATNTRLLPLENINGDVTYKPAAGTDIPNDFIVVATGSPATTTAVSLQSTAPPHAASAKLAINHSGNTTGLSAVYLGPTGVASGLLVVSTSNGGAGAQIRQQFESPNPYANGIHYTVGTNGTATIVSRGWRS